MVEGQEGVTWEQWLALADACERSGVEGLFRSDHYAGLGGDRDRAALDCWTTLAGLAARTERIRLGSMVSPATFRHPSVHAKGAATVDHISDGRVELGLGAGWNEREHRMYGFPFPPTSVRVEMFAEQLEIVHRQWTEDELDFDGRHYRLEGGRAWPKPLQQPRPPLIVGGAAKRGTVEPAVRFADEYDTTFSSPEECARKRRTLDEFCERAGRDPATLRFSLMTTLIVGRDEREVRDRARRVMERGSGDGDLDDWIAGRRDRTVIGTVDEVVARLRQYEAAGVERFFAQHLDHADVTMVELIGAEVAAAVA
jgi:F420-dependent oxidoreductase-like protein